MDLEGIWIQLVGDKARSDVVKIASVLLQLTQPFHRSTYDDFIFECAGDLGAVLVAEVGNDKNWLGLFGSPWFVDYLEVKSFNTKQDVTFPCYQWIGDGTAVSCMETCESYNCCCCTCGTVMFIYKYRI